MSKKKIVDISYELLNSYLDDKSIFIWNIEYVKEVKDWFLRVYIDRNDEEKISLEDCENVSRYLGEALDEIDAIEQNYYLEVSSPGVERELLKREHFDKYVDSAVEIRLFKPLDINGSKKFHCIIREVLDDKIKVSLDEDKIVEIGFKDIAKAKTIFIW